LSCPFGSIICNGIKALGSEFGFCIGNDTVELPGGFVIIEVVVAEVRGSAVANATNTNIGKNK
jgi:hypothetical protein